MESVVVNGNGSHAYPRPYLAHFTVSNDVQTGIAGRTQVLGRFMKNNLPQFLRFQKIQLNYSSLKYMYPLLSFSTSQTLRLTLITLLTTKKEQLHILAFCLFPALSLQFVFAVVICVFICVHLHNICTIQMRLVLY